MAEYNDIETGAENFKAEDKLEEEVDDSTRLAYQIANTVAFAILMVVTYVTNGQGIGIKLDNRQIMDQADTRFSPKGSAFSIWGVIYALQFVFVAYQLLPKRWVQSRNDQLIFGAIKYKFIAVSILQSFWLWCFGQNEVWSYIVAEVVIVAMLGFALWMFMDTNRHKVNVADLILVRISFTIFAGWVTAATILGAGIMIKAIFVGTKVVNNGAWAEMDNENFWAVFMIIVAFVVYVACTVREQNPMFGAVFLWVAWWIRQRQDIRSQIGQDRKPVPLVALVVFLLNAVFLLGFTGFLISKRMKDTKTHGLFYM